MTWGVFAAILRLLLTGLIIVKITKFRDTLNHTERFGLGVMGGCSFLTVHVLWQGGNSPYDGWAVGLLTLGALLFVGGRTWRDWQHQRANDQTIAWYKEHKAGKL